jgi:RNA recognition motif-containing protein
LRNKFKKYGTITNIKVPQKMGKPSGIAFLEFSKNSEAKAAIEGENGVELEGRALNLRFSNGGPPAGG